MCKSCGIPTCGGCSKSCIKVNRPTNWRGGQTGIPGPPGAPGVGITNIEDNQDNTFTIFLSDGSDYTITMPPFEGKHVVAINPVPGDDTEWELVYDDATTMIIDSPYYIVNTGPGAQLIYDQAGHPTKIRSLVNFGNNTKLEIDELSDEIRFNVKQYGRNTTIGFIDESAAFSYATLVNAEYENQMGGVSSVAKSGGGLVIDNNVTTKVHINILPFDAFKSVLYFHYKHSFDLTYNQTSYDEATNPAAGGKFHINLGLDLPNGTPNFPFDFWDNPKTRYFHGNHTVATYDIYRTPGEDTTNKLRRYAQHKVCDVIQQTNNGFETDDDPGWSGTGAVGSKLQFRYPYIDDLKDPAIFGQGVDAKENFTFESVGSMIINHDTNTDFLSTIAGEKNH